MIVSGAHEIVLVCVTKKVGERSGFRGKGQMRKPQSPQLPTRPKTFESNVSKFLYQLIS
jgi:hypothetical protein